MQTCEACGREFQRRKGRMSWTCPRCGYNNGWGPMPRKERPAGPVTVDEQEEEELNARDAQDWADRQEYQREHRDDQHD